jgi:hypothetical protein
MEEEKRGLYASIGSFVGKDWNGLGISPNLADRLPVRLVSLGALYCNSSGSRFLGDAGLSNGFLTALILDSWVMPV